MYDTLFFFSVSTDQEKINVRESVSSTKTENIDGSDSCRPLSQSGKHTYLLQIYFLQLIWGIQVK